MEANKITIVDYSEKAIAIIAEHDTALRDEYEAIGGRYNPRLACGAGWIFSKKKHESQIMGLFAAYSLADMVERVNLADIATDTQPRPAKSAKRDGATRATYALPDDERKEFLRRAYGNPPHGDEESYKEWKTCVRLASGDIVGIQSPKLETEFCFGYSCVGQGPTHDEACEACNAAKTEEYFVQENTEELRDILAGLKRERVDTTYNYLFLGRENTAARHKDCPTLYGLQWTDINTDSVNWYEFLGTCEREQYERGDIKALTDDDRKRLICEYERELTAREKRCRAYLRRYGTSKLRISTYWMDR